MNILVLNPSSKITKNVVRDVLYGCWCSGKRIGGGTVPPFALLMVASVLKEDGNEVVFLDAQAEQKTFSEMGDYACSVDVAVISTSMMTFTEDTQTLAYLKERNPNLKTIVLGSHPTFMPEYCLNNVSIDIIVRREPEFIIRDVIRKLRVGDSGWRNTAGIGYRHEGSVKINDYYPFIEDLDELCFLDTKMLPKDIDYFNPLIKRMPYITTTVSRGCPGKCEFCTAPSFDGMRVRFRSPESVIAEVKTYLARGYKEIYFRDDTFFVNRERSRTICEKMIEEKLDVTWLCNARVGMIKKDDMSLMKEAGCHYLKFGVESGVQEILDLSRKGILVEQTRDTFKWAKEVNIDTHAHVMLGMPGETEATLRQTIDFVLEINPTTATFGICTPYPGTPLFDKVAKFCPDICDGTQTDLSSLHTQGFFNKHYTSLTAGELEKWVPRAYRKFYLRANYWLRRIMDIRGIDDIRKYSIAASNVLSFSLKGSSKASHSKGES